jgi:hypothetical protein
MLIQRFYDLEHEYRQVITRIVETDDEAELAYLYDRRRMIVVEAREVIDNLNVPEPRWSNGK